jgi:16S rRNA (uracil1498-N3)-methyltransferase
MRGAVGDRVELFDGRGAAAIAEVVARSRKSATLKLLERTFDNAPDSSFTLASAVPKGDRFRWLIEKATELGVDRLVPLQTARGVVQPRETKLGKMQQTVVAACKQSGRNWLMKLEEMTSFDAFVAGASREGVLLVAHPAGKPLVEVLTTCAKRQRIIAAVGPEGGFTESEMEDAVAAGAALVGLGPTILRTETAALAIAACVMQHRPLRQKHT